MTSSKGFTIIELIIVTFFASLLFVFFFIQYSNITAMQRDESRKTAINAIYYALEESYYPEHGYYPEYISESVLPVVTPALWTDPDGHQLGTPQSSYSYTAANCDSGRCKEYTLTARLEKEAPYTKYNQS